MLAFFTSLASDELPESKAADVDDDDDDNDAAPSLTFRTTRGDGFLSSRGGALLLVADFAAAVIAVFVLVAVVLVLPVAARARAAARTAEAEWGVRVGRLSVGRFGCCDEATVAGADDGCLDFGFWLAPAAAAFLLSLLLNADGRFRAAGESGLGGGGAGFLEALDEDAVVPYDALFMRAASSRWRSRICCSSLDTGGAMSFFDL